MGKQPFKGYRGWAGKNKITVVDGVKFSSKREANYWILLRGREEKGEITMLRRQVRFPIEVTHCITGIPTLLTTYVADYTWLDSDGNYRVCDAKPPNMQTPEAVIKLKMMAAIMGLTVELV